MSRQRGDFPGGQPASQLQVRAAMSGPIVRTGPSPEYMQRFAAAFGVKKAKAGAKPAAKPAAPQKPAKKAAAAKKAAPAKKAGKKK